jgi:ATP-binding cassette subfamily B protein
VARSVTDRDHQRTGDDGALMTAVREGAAYLRRRVAARVAIARLLPLAGRRLALGAICANLVSGLAPIGFVIATSVLAGRLPEAAADGWHSPSGRAVVWAIAVAGASLAVQQGLSPLLAVLGERIARRIDSTIRDRLAAASVASPTVAALEDDELLRFLSEAGAELEYNPNTPGRAVAGLVSLINRYTPVAASVVLIGIVFSPAPHWPTKRRSTSRPVSDQAARRLVWSSVSSARA